MSRLLMIGVLQSVRNAVVDLTLYNAALAAVTEADYTPTSWTAYQLIVGANVVDGTNTQGEIDTATSNITTAQGDLVSAKSMPANSVLDFDPDFVITDIDGLISAVIDQGSLENNAVQANDDYKPLLVENAWNGESVMRFTPVVDGPKFLKTAELDLSQPTTTYLVCKKVANILVQTMLYGWKGLGWKISEVNKVLEAGSGTNIKFSDSDIINGIVVTYVANGINSEVYENGVLVGYGNTGTAPIKGVAIGANAYLDQIPSYGEFKGDIGKVTIYSSAHNSATREQGEDYLMTRFGITATKSLTYYTTVTTELTEANYTAGSWVTYQGVITSTTVTISNTQSEINAAVIAVKMAQADLVNLVAYNLAIVAVTEPYYTIASWSTYQGVVMNNVPASDATQGQVDTATNNITNAQANLVLKLASYNSALGAVVAEDYTPESWATYQIVVGNNVVDHTYSEQDIATATNNITTAQADLVPIE